MYEQVFNLNERPFTSTPFVKHFFPAEAIGSALKQVRMCIDRATGPAIVIGNSGTGKSLLLAALAEQYSSSFQVANLACARLDERMDLLQSILFELDQPYRDMTEGEMRLSLLDYLKPSEQCPDGVVLLVDEAHQLSVGLLDEIRLITNFVCDGQPRIRLVMAGNQKLEDSLSDPKLDSFNQRIVARCYLSNLTRDETREYVTAHIDRAGGSGGTLFPIDGLDAIHDASEGCPRIINQICAHALLLAASNGLNTISADTIRQAWADVQCIPGAWAPASSGQADESIALYPADENGSVEFADDSNSLNGIRTQSDEEWTVIEFGELDEDDKDDRNAALETSGPVEEIPVVNVYDHGRDDKSTPEEFGNLDIGQTVESSQTEYAENSGIESGPLAHDDSMESDSTENNSIELGSVGFSHDQETEIVSGAVANESVIDQEDAYQLAPLDDSTERPSLSAVDVESATSDSGNELSLEEEIVDPFAEAFDQEESVSSQFSPLVAEQNICSLTVTKDQLKLLKPIDQGIQESADGERFETNEYRELVQLVLPSEQEFNEPRDDESADAGHVSDSNNGLGVEEGKYTTGNEGQSIETIETIGFAPETAGERSEYPGQHSNASDDSAITETAGAQPESNEVHSSVPLSGAGEPIESAQSVQGDSPAFAAVNSIGSFDSRFQYDGQPGDQSHVVVSVMDDLRLTPEEMQQLDSVEAAVERIEAASTTQPYEEVIADTKEESSPPSAPTLLEASVLEIASSFDAEPTPIEALSDGSEMTEANGNLSLPSFPTSPVEAMEKTEGEMLLDKIREMQQAVVENEAESVAAAQDSPHTISIEYPVTQHEAYQEDGDGNTDSNDDRDMLIVSRTEQPSPEQDATDSSDYMMDEPSTGNATRMDYQKLFEQLRNKE